MKVKEIKGNMDGVSTVLRVVQVLPPRTVKTKKGEEITIKELIAGDETGKIKIVLWENFGEIKQGDVIKLENCWTTVFKNEIELNAGKKSRVIVINDNTVPQIEQIPDVMQNDGEYRIPLKKK